MFGEKVMFCAMLIWFGVIQMCVWCDKVVGAWKAIDWVWYSEIVCLVGRVRYYAVVC